MRTLSPFTGTGMFEVDFPIDVVYMWVDGVDPAWVDRKNEALVARRGWSRCTSRRPTERFRDNGGCRYSMRSVEQYASWVRHIYVVTDRQLPDWLDPDHPRITVVDQRDLFDGTGTVPSFNSHAIGARLHHIPGLSEHYLHFNDDFFLARPVLAPALLHEQRRLEVLPLAQRPSASTTTGRPSPTSSPGATSSNLLEADFGRVATSRTFFHTPIVQRRSTMLELRGPLPRRCSRRRGPDAFRSSSDFEINSWLHHYYGYLTGRPSSGSIRYDYFDVADAAGVAPHAAA